MSIRQTVWRWLLSFHRILGTILSLFVLMWFLSGMVMLYHDFPRVGDKALPYMDALPAESADSLSLLYRNKLQGLTLRVHDGQPVYALSLQGGEREIRHAHTLTPIQPVTSREEARRNATKWGNISAESVLKDRLDTWVPLPRHRDHLPIYRFEIDDESESYLYFSSKTGELLQAVSAEERFWSYLGPIPHYLYIWQLRQNASLWVRVIVWIAGAGAVMCLSGIVIGVTMYVKVWRRKLRFASPYKKPYSLKWHHIFGFFFGLFIFTFLLSGALSFGNLPDFLRKKVHDTELRGALIHQEAFAPDSILLSDLQALLSSHSGEVKQIDVCRFGDAYYYCCAFADGHRYLSVDESGEIVPHLISEEEVRDYLTPRIPYPFTIEKIERYDDYYTGRKKNLPELPAYKVSIDDKDAHRLYVQPMSGRMQAYNASSHAASWIYPKLHNFRMGSLLTNNNTLRLIIVWILLIGGTVVNFTGVQLSIRFLVRKLRKRKVR